MLLDRIASCSLLWPMSFASTSCPLHTHTHRIQSAFSRPLNAPFLPLATPPPCRQRLLRPRWRLSLRWQGVCEGTRQVLNRGSRWVAAVGGLLLVSQEAGVLCFCKSSFAGETGPGLAPVSLLRTAQPPGWGWGRRCAGRLSMRRPSAYGCYTDSDSAYLLPWECSLNLIPHCCCRRFGS
jgi:hypothetical protein